MDERHLPASEAWYEAFSEPMQQGDVFFDFPLLSITYDGDGEEPGLARAKQTVVVLTQSCDIPKAAQTELLMASVFDFEALRESHDRFRSSDFKSGLSRGTVISEFAIPPHPQNGNQYLVASFRKLHVIPKKYVEANIASAARLRSPYKEYFAQAYARFVMRVGLPYPLPEIE